MPAKTSGLPLAWRKHRSWDKTLTPPAISINDRELDVIHDFVYLGSAVSDTLSLDAEFNRRIGKAATTMTRLTKKAWNNSKLTVHTKIQIYRACVVTTLLYGSEPWTLRAWQERKLNAFHTHSLRRILNITWQDKVPNNTVLERAGCTSMFTLLKQRRMRWLGHVVRMDDGRIPWNLLHGELVQGKCATGRPQLRFKDVCKRDLKALNIDQNKREATALKRSAWRQTVQKGLSKFEETLAQQHKEMRMRRKAAAHADRLVSDFVCALCHRDCHSRIGLVSHTRRCTWINT